MDDPLEFYATEYPVGVEPPEVDEAPAYSVDEADLYRHSNRVPYQSPGRVGGVTMPVLPMLIGLPWNGLALNMVHALRPSCIRVIEPMNMVTTDYVRWRVTVWLEADRRTIEAVDQAVVVGLRGCHHGADVRNKLRGQR